MGGVLIGLAMLGGAVSEGAVAVEPRAYQAEDAADCLALSTYLSEMDMEPGDPLRGMKRISVRWVPIWEYELDRSVGGDVAKAEKKLKTALKRTRARYKRHDGAGGLRIIFGVNECRKLLCSQYPQGHPLDQEDFKSCQA